MINKAIPLGFMTAGKSAVVADLAGACGMRRRMIEMGLACGAQIKVLANDRRGPLIIAVGEGRLAIGRGMALRILVDETG